MPRSIATPQYLGAAKLRPKIDAYLEPWTMLGHLAARNRCRAVATGYYTTVSVTLAAYNVPADAVDLKR